MNAEDKIRTFFAAPLGVIAGVFASAVVDLLALGQTRMVLIILGAIALFVAFEWVSDRLSLGAMEKLSDRSPDELAEVRKKKLVGRHSRLPRYVFLAAAIAGFLATFIWPAATILAVFT